MIPKVTEKGQALIVIAFAAMALMAFAALAIDGSRVYSDKRHAQNAADTAALAGALAYARDGATIDDGDIIDISQNRATSNGYDNNGTSNEVTITPTDVPAGNECKNGGKDITVTIVSHVDTTFARVIGRNQVTNAVTATAQACDYYLDSLFDGNAIVGLNPGTDTCAFDSGQSNSAHWKLEGGGIFSNGCAESKDLDAVDLSGGCVTTVGSAEGFTCQQTTSKKIKYPADVDAIMPPNPCDGTPGDIGLPPPASGSTFVDGVYCISDFDQYDKADITLYNATLYVTDPKFTLKFSGSGGFYGTPTDSGDFKNYYMVIARVDPPCEDFNHGDQVIEWRGNGSGSFYGTILAPSACLDLRGNGDSDGMHTQVIGYTVSSNGNAGGKDEVYINFKAEENHKIPVYPEISVLK